MPRSDTQITSLKGSLSWRVIKPLLVIKNKMKRVWYVLRFSIKHAGGLRNTIKRVAWIYRSRGLSGIKRTVRRVDQINPANQISPTSWFARYRAAADYGAIQCRGSAQFSIVMPVYKVRPEWLAEAIASVVGQTYPHWELICVDDGSKDDLLNAILARAASNDPRVKYITLEQNQGVSRATNIGIEQATGEYLLFMDHDDMLEPHGLARLSDAAFSEDADILYGDEVVTSENLEEIIGVQLRPAFSHTYYLSYPFFVHPVAVRSALARRIGGLNTSLTISQDIDFVLRALEIAKNVTHIPDILYRWRTHPESTGRTYKQDAINFTTCALKTEHLRRIGFDDADVRPGPSFNTFNVRYFGVSSGRILGVIPTKNQAGLLRLSIETLRETTKGLDLDLVIIDHQSDDPETLSYLRELEHSGAARILSYQGKFNYSAINNYAVFNSGAGYDYYLFLNNDIEATKPGWLDAMLDLAMRADVGAVGATLLYPDGTVQHSGVIVGMHDSAEHAFKTVLFRSDEAGYGASLHATREYSAVTAACMLVPAEVFHAVGGYDEKLEVGYNDTDLCLRIGQKGYRVVNCAEAILVHHESASRGKSLDGRDRHPRDSALFRRRYKDFLRGTDPHFSPLLAKDNPTFVLDFSARLATRIDYATVTDFLPKGRRGRDHGAAHAVAAQPADLAKAQASAVDLGNYSHP